MAEDKWSREDVKKIERLASNYLCAVRRGQFEMESEAALAVCGRSAALNGQLYGASFVLIEDFCDRARWSTSTLARPPHRPLLESPQAFPPPQPKALTRARELVSAALQQSLGKGEAPAATLEQGFERLLKLVRSASAGAEVARCFARPALRSALSCLAPQHCVHKLLEQAESHCPLGAEKALLLRSQALSCSGNQWNKSERLLERARSLLKDAGGDSVAAHLEAFSAALHHPTESIESYALEAVRAAQSAESEDEAAQAAEECMLFALACRSARGCVGVSWRGHPKQVEPLLAKRSPEALLKTGREVARARLAANHPLLAVINVASELVSRPLERTKEEGAASSRVKALWTRVHIYARKRLQRAAGWLEHERDWLGLRWRSSTDEEE